MLRSTGMLLLLRLFSVLPGHSTCDVPSKIEARSQVTTNPIHWRTAGTPPSQCMGLAWHQTTELSSIELKNKSLFIRKLSPF